MADAIQRLLIENIQPRTGRGGWHGGPTPVRALRGVTAEEAAWVPAPGRHSIWALALHIAYWKHAVRRRLAERLEPGEMPGRFARSPANWPRVPDPPDERAWRDDVRLLREEHDLLVATVARIPVSRYGVVLPGAKRWTVGEQVLGIAQHDAYHTGQIQMLRRLREASRR